MNFRLFSGLALLPALFYLCACAGPASVALAPSSDVVFGYRSTNLAGGEVHAKIVSRLSHLKIVPMATEAIPPGVDVIVQLTHMGRGGDQYVQIDTLSARSNVPLSSGRASYRTMNAYLEDTARFLNAEFAIGKPLYRKLRAERDGRISTDEVSAVVPASSDAAPTYNSDIEVPPFALPEDESKFALVVGVELYQEIPNADHAVRDARTMRSYLKAAGYPERNIIFLSDQQAGKSSLEKYLEAWLPRNTDEHSTVFFYFSGHGASDPNKGESYLMPWDADARFTETTGYPVKRLYAKLNALRAGRVLVALDACFSGAGSRSVMAKGLRPLISKVDDGRSAVGKVAALTASAANEMTGSDEVSGHGLFTYQFLKALTVRGAKASFKDLFDVLSPKVRDSARRENRDQTPQLIGAGDVSL